MLDKTLNSVTRFGKTLKGFGQCSDDQLNIGQNVKPLLAHFMILGKFRFFENGQILKNESSHLVTLTLKKFLPNFERKT